MSKLEKEYRNAKDEFLKIIEKYKIIASDISYNDISGNFRECKLKPLFNNSDYDEFLELLNGFYDNGYGGQNLYGVIFCEDGVWMQRGEYDGSEWWDIYQYPNLRNTFTESDVIKYERYKKIKKLE